MNKAELTAAIVKKTGFTKKDAEKAIAAVTDVITETLAAGEKVQIVGFGGFEVRSRPRAWPAIPAPASRSASRPPRPPSSRPARL